jgi:hypothetical protein
MRKRTITTTEIVKLIGNNMLKLQKGIYGSVFRVLPISRWVFTTIIPEEASTRKNTLKVIRESLDNTRLHFGDHSKMSNFICSWLKIAATIPSPQNHIKANLTISFTKKIEEKPKNLSPTLIKISTRIKMLTPTSRISIIFCMNVIVFSSIKPLLRRTNTYCRTIKALMPSESKGLFQEPSQ